MSEISNRRCTIELLHLWASGLLINATQHFMNPTVSVIPCSVVQSVNASVCGFCVYKCKRPVAVCCWVQLIVCTYCVCFLVCYAGMPEI